MAPPTAMPAADLETLPPASLPLAPLPEVPVEDPKALAQAPTSEPPRQEPPPPTPPTSSSVMVPPPSPPETTTALPQPLAPMAPPTAMPATDLETLPPASLPLAPLPEAPVEDPKALAQAPTSEPPRQEPPPPTPPTSSSVMVPPPSPAAASEASQPKLPLQDMSPTDPGGPSTISRNTGIPASPRLIEKRQRDDTPNNNADPASSSATDGEPAISEVLSWTTIRHNFVLRPDPDLIRRVAVIESKRRRVCCQPDTGVEFEDDPPVQSTEEDNGIRTLAPGQDIRYEGFTQYCELGIFVRIVYPEQPTLSRITSFKETQPNLQVFENALGYPLVQVHDLSPTEFRDYERRLLIVLEALFEVMFNRFEITPNSFNDCYARRFFNFFFRTKSAIIPETITVGQALAFAVMAGFFRRDFARLFAVIHLPELRDGDGNQAFQQGSVLDVLYNGYVKILGALGQRTPKRSEFLEVAQVMDMHMPLIKHYFMQWEDQDSFAQAWTMPTRDHPSLGETRLNQVCQKGPGVKCTCLPATEYETPGNIMRLRWIPGQMQDYASIFQEAKCCDDLARRKARAAARAASNASNGAGTASAAPSEEGPTDMNVDSPGSGETQAGGEPNSQPGYDPMDIDKPEENRDRFINPTSATPEGSRRSVFEILQVTDAERLQERRRHIRLVQHMKMQDVNCLPCEHFTEVCGFATDFAVKILVNCGFKLRSIRLCKALTYLETLLRAEYTDDVTLRDVLYIFLLDTLGLDSCICENIRVDFPKDVNRNIHLEFLSTITDPHRRAHAIRAVVDGHDFSRSQWQKLRLTTSVFSNEMANVEKRSALHTSVCEYKACPHTV
ncbi:hypothetical protein HK105_207509 [Polyrhizophydium stewartii]